MNLDPNVWFGNVELVAAEDIGEETVIYVRNVYKYYVAYKLAADRARSGPRARLPSPLSMMDIMRPQRDVGSTENASLVISSQC